MFTGTGGVGLQENDSHGGSSGEEPCRRSDAKVELGFCAYERFVVESGSKAIFSSSYVESAKAGGLDSHFGISCSSASLPESRRISNWPNKSMGQSGIPTEPFFSAGRIACEAERLHVLRRVSCLWQEVAFRKNTAGIWGVFQLLACNKYKERDGQ